MSSAIEGSEELKRKGCEERMSEMMEKEMKEEMEEGKERKRRRRRKMRWKKREWVRKPSPVHITGTPSYGPRTGKIIHQGTSRPKVAKAPPNSCL